MATTTPDNIWTPDAGDGYALTTDLARTADDVQNALNGIHALTGDTGWQPLGSFASGWSSVSGTVTPGWRTVNHVTYLRGRISCTSEAGNTPFSTPLPSTSSPSFTVDTLIHNTSASGFNASVNSAGQINILHSGAVYDILLSSYGGIPVG